MDLRLWLRFKLKRTHCWTEWRSGRVLLAVVQALSPVCKFLGRLLWGGQYRHHPVTFVSHLFIFLMAPSDHYAAVPSLDADVSTSASSICPPSTRSTSYYEDSKNLSIQCYCGKHVRAWSRGGIQTMPSFSCTVSTNWREILSSH